MQTAISKSELSSKWGKALVTTRFWALANLIGLIAFLGAAGQTWDIDHALGGLFPEFFFMNVEALMFAVVDVIWLVVILINAFRTKNWFPLLMWLLALSFWIGAIKYHDYRFGLEIEAAKNS